MGDAGLIRSLLPALVIAVVLAAGCGDDGADSASDAGTTPTAGAQSESAEDEARLEEVVEALYAGQAAVCQALGPPTPDADHPDLLATRTGPVLETLEDLAEEFREEGVAFHCPEDSLYDIDVLSFEFGKFEGDEAVWLEACVVDDGEEVVVETGEVVGGGLVAVYVSDALRRIDGQWKLAERRVDGTWEGEEQCDID